MVKNWQVLDLVHFHPSHRAPTAVGARDGRTVAAPPGILPLAGTGETPRSGWISTPSPGCTDANCCGNVSSQIPKWTRNGFFALEIKKELTHMHWGWVLLPAQNKNLKLSDSVPLLKIKTSVLYRLDIEANLFTGWKSQVHFKMQVFKSSSC